MKATRLSQGLQTIELADALIAGTARVHGAVLVTDDITDFPIRDVRVQPPSEA